MKTWAGKSLDWLALAIFFTCIHLMPQSAFAAASPSITAQPQSQALLAGTNASFSVVASGQTPLFYQWSLNGTNLANSPHLNGATNATLTISNLVADDAGNYQVVVSNSHGSVISSNVTLVVVLPPRLSGIPNQRTFHNLATKVIPFTVSNVLNATLSAFSTDTNLVPTNNIVFGGTGTNRTIVLIPATNQTGTATITVNVINTFGQAASTSFSLTIDDFSVVATNLAGLFRGSMNWVDYDNDGYLDLFECGYDLNFNPQTRLYHNNHDSTFTEVATPFPPSAEVAADWADFDGDGFIDLVIQGQVFRNLKGTNFAYVTSVFNGSAAWCDWDNDGKPDLMDAAYSSTWLHHNNGDGTFSIITNFYGNSASVGDYNNDGWVDVLVGAKLYQNTGNNFFIDSGWSLAVYNNLGWYGFSGAWGDYNNDGWPDLLVSGSDASLNGTNVLFKNNSGSLTYVPENFPPFRDGAAAWGDFDNDGNLDFFSFGLILGVGYQSTLYHNSGTNSVFTDSGLAFPGLFEGAAAWGDYDNDGALDLVCQNRYGPSTKLYHNDGAMPDHPPTAPTGLTVTRSRNAAIFSWTASTDLDQSGGLTYNLRIGTTNGAVDVLSPCSDPITGFRRLPKSGNAGYRTSFLITNLPAGNYYWSVQAVDNAFKGSAFAAQQSFNLPAPAITNQPQSLTVLSGAMVNFQVGATGEPPLFYGWSQNGTNLINATNSTLTLTNVQRADSANYAVTVSNQWGVVISSNAVLVVNTQPKILAQPQDVTAIEGQNVSYAVNVYGDAPLVYQWKFNGTNLANATNATLSLKSIIPAQAGTYSVLITNDFGFTNSVAALLTIPPSKPFIVIQPTGQYAPAGLGINVSFSMSVIGTTPLAYQWRFNGSDILGATQSIYTVTQVQNSDVGAYSVLITNLVGQTLSADAMLSVTPGDSSTNQFIAYNGVSDFIYDDLRDTLYLVSGGNNVQRYQLGTASFLAPIPINGTLVNLDLSPDGNLLAIADQTTGTNAQFQLVDLNTSSVRQAVLTNFSGFVSSLAFGNDGAVVCEVGALIVRYDPATGISTQRNRLINIGSGPMTASADHSTIGIYGDGGYTGVVLTYNVASLKIDGLMYLGGFDGAAPIVNRDGSLIAQPAGGSLQVATNLHAIDTSGSTITNIANLSGAVFSPNQDLLFCGKNGTRELHGYETVSFTDSFMLDFGTNITSSRMRTSRDGAKIFGAVPGGVNWLNWTSQAPHFLIQPTNQTVLAGSNITFTSRVAGSPAVKYQWQVGGVSIPNATNAAFSLSGQPFHTGTSNYTVIAYNPCGYLISSNALLTIVSPPYVVIQPQSQSVGAASNATFTIVADGSPTLAYQWRLNGTNLTGATNLTYAITNVQATNAGNFTVVITNVYGRATTDVAVLTVVPTTPWLVLQPQSQTINVSSSAAFSVRAMGSEPLGYRWFTNSAALVNGHFSGVFTTNLTIANVQSADAGGYYAIVTNNYGSITSSVATLTVYSPVQITGQPVSQAALLVSNASFTVNITGSSPAFQWYFNGIALTDGGRLSGSTLATLNIANVQSSDAGNYTVKITNLLASVTSRPATLTVKSVAGPSVRYVNLINNSPASPYLDWGTAATNIQDAVDAAVAGDLILVTNGIYNTGGRIAFIQLTNRVIIDKPVTVRSVNGPSVTVLYGSSSPSVRCAYLSNGATLSGFTLTNGNTIRGSNNPYPEDSGGGVWCASRGEIVTNCFITRNFASYGGGAYLGTLVNCNLETNSAVLGGGGFSNTLNNCRLKGNFVSGNGAGAYGAVLINCTVVSNSTPFSSGGGGGIYNSSASNSIIYFNFSGKDPNFPATTPMSYCCTPTVATNGFGNITNAPLFANFAGGDFHLQGNSPCINAGNNTFATGAKDFDGNPRIVGGAVDIGAYEFQAPASILSYVWAQQYGLPTDGSADLLDTDADGVNNLSEWKSCTVPTNAASVLQLASPTFTNNPPRIVVTWQSVAGVVYYLQRSPDLGAGFSTIVSNLLGPAGTTTSYTDTTATNSALYFYRVGVQ